MHIIIVIYMHSYFLQHQFSFGVRNKHSFNRNFSHHVQILLSKIATIERVICVLLALLCVHAYVCSWACESKSTHIFWSNSACQCSWKIFFPIPVMKSVMMVSINSVAYVRHFYIVEEIEVVQKVKLDLVTWKVFFY